MGAKSVKSEAHIQQAVNVLNTSLKINKSSCKSEVVKNVLSNMIINGEVNITGSNINANSNIYTDCKINNTTVNDIIKKLGTITKDFIKQDPGWNKVIDKDIIEMKIDKIIKSHFKSQNLSNSIRNTTQNLFSNITANDLNFNPGSSLNSSMEIISRDIINNIVSDLGQVFEKIPWEKINIITNKTEIKLVENYSIYILLFLFLIIIIIYLT